MFFIPGFLISLVTFPGVIVHELAHQLFCRLMKVPVFEVCYFQFSNPSGYVIHEVPKNPRAQIWISLGPFFVNSILGALISLPGAIDIIKFDDYSNQLSFFFVWLGVSIAMHSFPSIEDSKNMWKAVWDKRTPIISKLLALPIVAIMYICSLGSVVWLDLVYGVFLAMAIPYVLIQMLI